MLGTSPVIAFAATTDAAASLAFYRDVLGLTLVADEPYALVFDAHGTMLRIQKTQAHTPAPHTLLGWHVTDIAETMRGLAACGARFERYDFMEQDAAGVWTTPSGARVAWFKDPDGNLLSLTAF